MRVSLLKATGDAAAVKTELARLCAAPTEAMKGTCADRLGEQEFRTGTTLFAKYKSLKLVIPSKVNLTRKGIERLSTPKRQLLTELTGHFTKSIASGVPEWIGASSYYVGLAQWEYGDYLKNVQLPADLTPEQASAAKGGAAQMAEQYYEAARKTWQALVDKATQDKINNPWIDRARAAVAGNVDTSPTASEQNTTGALNAGGGQ
jgi:hypothetical protein